MKDNAPVSFFSTTRRIDFAPTLYYLEYRELPMQSIPAVVQFFDTPTAIANVAALPSPRFDSLPNHSAAHQFPLNKSTVGTSCVTT